MSIREYDRDSEEIEPLVPYLARSTEQTSVRGASVPDRGPRQRDVDRLPHLHQTPYYTWDVETIEPGVPLVSPELE